MLANALSNLYNIDSLKKEEIMIHCKYSADTHVEIKTEGIADILHTAHDGTGKYVTPGDMLVASLGACTLTMIGAVAQQFHQKMDGVTLTAKPEFAPNAQGLKRVELHISLPAGTPEDMRKRCLAAARACPVHKSLNPAIEVVITHD